MPSSPPPGRERGVAVAAAARDAGLHRIRRLTRWAATGAVGLTGVFAGLAAHATASSNHATTTQTGADAAAQSAPPSSGDEYSYGSDDGTYGSEDGYGDGSTYGSEAGGTAQAPAPSQSTSPPVTSSGAS